LTHEFIPVEKIIRGYLKEYKNAYFVVHFACCREIKTITKNPHSRIFSRLCLPQPSLTIAGSSTQLYGQEKDKKRVKKHSKRVQQSIYLKCLRTSKSDINREARK
jgi:hypothetical protein